MVILPVKQWIGNVWFSIYTINISSPWYLNPNRVPPMASLQMNLLFKNPFFCTSGLYTKDVCSYFYSQYSTSSCSMATIILTAVSQRLPRNDVTRLTIHVGQSHGETQARTF